LYAYLKPRRRREMEMLCTSEIIGDHKYDVFIDETPIEGSFDFGDEEANAEYLRRFENDEIGVFIVVKYAKCGTCENWHEIDALCGIHDIDAQSALKYYYENYA
jgi:hypothetical protein